MIAVRSVAVDFMARWSSMSSRPRPEKKIYQWIYTEQCEETVVNNQKWFESITFERCQLNKRNNFKDVNQDEDRNHHVNKSQPHLPQILSRTNWEQMCIRLHCAWQESSPHKDSNQKMGYWNKWTPWWKTFSMTEIFWCLKADCIDRHV
jgi:hypothetical protein